MKAVLKQIMITVENALGQKIAITIILHMMEIVKDAVMDSWENVIYNV